MNKSQGTELSQRGVFLSCVCVYLASLLVGELLLKYLFIWLHQALAAAQRLFSCNLWDLVP